MAFNDFPFVWVFTKMSENLMFLFPPCRLLTTFIEATEAVYVMERVYGQSLGDHLLEQGG